MAKSHYQPLFLLLASLLFLPTLHAVDFKYCNGIGYVDKITKVEISPDDPSTVTISGLTRRGLVYAGTVVVASGIGEFNIPFKYYDFCQMCKCPMLSGTNFVFTLSKILIPKAFASDKLAVTLSLISRDQTEGVCVYFDFPTSANSMLNQASE
ncbi:putative sterol transport protein NPC2 [Arabidopsis thaliana]|uniref:MD-2-related lipid-recognition domain-containing protein n=2 Tax=Arabidopsis TaxID=3701 RepID=A0A178W7I1_ARATH|nr:MD-2-related lipid-recognition domain [Arabidopsis thaliana x Arabidopsis arenosa]OAP14308.1 hypothetical protein AXX17_AT1G40690 [Arabidopsis thaliana]CAA0274482.1 unnamed protein product [Arabidopsis thaliana]VYS48302.1 unnamed protein product [Arabidopsis thaliana]